MVTCRKKEAKFVYNSCDNESHKLYGPTYVDFLNLSSGDVYGQVLLWIQFVDCEAHFYSFPSITGLSEHIVAVSILVEDISFVLALPSSHL